MDVYLHSDFGSYIFHAQVSGPVRNMGMYITMSDAVEQSAEEICMFHNLHGFSRDITHHTGRNVLRFKSHLGADWYDDMGNWAGSVFMYALLFQCGLIRIFDQTGERAVVLWNWGSAKQRSGKGQDNDRTNLLESILSEMGLEHCTKTQMAWCLFRRYALRYKHLSRQQLLHQALHDPATDVYSEDDFIAENIMKNFRRAWDTEVCVKLTLLFIYVRRHCVTPDYAWICTITGCSTRNRALKQLYWAASDTYRLGFWMRSMGTWV